MSICVLLVIFLILVNQAHGVCNNHALIVDDRTTDPPTYDAANSGILTTDTLTLKFTWPSYGPSDARTIDTALTGFVPLGNAGGALCSSHTLGNSGTVEYDTSNCVDYTNQTEAWAALKAACGSVYFANSTTASTYEVSFIYRITYTETLSSELVRTVQNDYSLVVTAPTSFSVESNSVTVAGTTTFVTTQTVTTDATGELTIGVTTISDCGNTITITTPFVVNNGGHTQGTVSIVSKGSVLTSGPYIDLCPFTWNFGVTPATSTACNINGQYDITYTVAFPDNTETSFTTSINLLSSNTCTTVTATTLGAPTFGLTLWEQAGGGGTQLVDTVALESTGHWKLTVTVPAINGVPIPTLTIDKFYNNLDSTGFTEVTGENLTSIALTVPDGTTTTTGTPVTSYDLYFSHKWITAVFAKSPPLTDVKIKIDFHLVYPAITRALARRAQSQFHSATSPAITVRSSEGAAEGAAEGTAVARSDNTVLVVVGAIAGVMLVALIVVAAVLVVRKRRKNADASRAIDTIGTREEFAGLENADL